MPKLNSGVISRISEVAGMLLQAAAAAAAVVKGRRDVRVASSSLLAV